MGKNYRNYSIKGSKGKFYESSKDMMEGFNIKYETQSKEIRYHRESDALEGVLKKIAIKEFQFDKGKVKYLRIMFDEISGDRGTLSIPLLTSKGGLDPWIKAFMLYLPALKKGQEIKIQLNRQHRDKNKYLYKNVWMHDGDDEQIKWAFDPKPSAGIVPQPVEGRHPTTGEKTLDWGPVDRWYYDYMMKVIDAWGGQEDEAEELAENESYVTGDEYAGKQTPDDTPDTSAYDDLPF